MILFFQCGKYMGPLVNSSRENWSSKRESACVSLGVKSAILYNMGKLSFFFLHSYWFNNAVKYNCPNLFRCKFNNLLFLLFTSF